MRETHIVLVRFVRLDTRLKWQYFKWHIFCPIVHVWFLQSAKHICVESDFF